MALPLCLAQHFIVHDCQGLFFLTLEFGCFAQFPVAQQSEAWVVEAACHVDPRPHAPDLMKHIFMCMLSTAVWPNAPAMQED